MLAFNVPLYLSFLVIALSASSSFAAHSFQYKRATPSLLVTDPSSLNGQSFDYVIVGGGTSGLAAASQLSKDTSKKILVIEGGGDPRSNPKVTSFSAYTQAFGDSQLEWNFNTVPQSNAGSKSIPIHAGKGLGGSTNINGGVFSVPPSSQVDALGDLGNQDWSWSTLLPFLKSYQNYHPPSSSQIALGMGYDASSHSSGGPVDLEYPSPQSDGQDVAFRNSVQSQLNVPQAGDLGSGVVNGAAFLAKFTKSGTDRVTSATAFYSPIESSRSNLIILINSRATKMLWQAGSVPAQASGVEYQSQQNGPKYSVKAGKVIVAAGALRSPKFLELSGVGDSRVLGKIGVQSVVDLAGVGSNLIEQAKTVVQGGSPKAGTYDANRSNNEVAFLLLSQLMSNASTTMEGYVESKLDAWAQDAVNSGASVSKDGLLLQYKTMVNGIFHRNWPVVEYNYVAYQGGSQMQIWDLLTFSRGTSHASTNSVWTKSDVDPRYFTASLDMDIQVAAMRGARKTFQAPAFKGVIDGQETEPGFDANNGGIPQGTNFGSYSRWQKNILDSYQSVWHVVGTCAMMPLQLGGVVGPDFKVYKTANVWVIDASVIPMPLSTHLASVVYAMAMRAAEAIKSG